MREIKFRGKRIDNNNWLYGCLIVDEISGKHYISLSVDESEKLGEEGCLKIVSCEVYPETVGQYTGLKDKNGVEIYEGDIIVSKTYPFYGDAPEITSSSGKCEDLNYVGVVGIDTEGVYYDVKVVSNRVSGRASGGNLSDIDCVEVIGNIHKNHELLTREE